MIAMRAFCHCIRDETGASAIEYGLICGIIATALISIIATGGSVDNLFNEVQEIADAID